MPPHLDQDAWTFDDLLDVVTRRSIWRSCAACGRAIWRADSARCCRELPASYLHRDLPSVRVLKMLRDAQTLVGGRRQRRCSRSARSDRRHAAMKIEFAKAAQDQGRGVEAIDHRRVAARNQPTRSAC
jgi:hypothetical protein